MDHCKDSENEVKFSILRVKLEPFYEDDDSTQNLDPLEQLDSNVHTKLEVLQNFKIETDGCGQAMNKLIQEDIMKNDLGDTEPKIEEIKIKTEYIGDEASALDSCGIIEDDTIVHSQLAGNNGTEHTEHGSTEVNKQTGEKNITRYELSHSCVAKRSGFIKEECTIDANLFNTTSLANHIRGVDDLRIDKHSTSEEEGSKQSYLIAHLPPDRSNVCDVCDMTFKNSRNLVSHIVVCKTELQKSSHLAALNTIHTDQKPFVCDICKKGFNYSSHLVRHQRTHTGHKPYSCDVCKRGFSDMSNLVAHQRTHTGHKPYICDICKRGFSDLSTLVAHQRTHAGQKPHVCDICEKGFSQSSHLVAHKRIHTGQKPHVCDVCHKGFSQASNLFIHKRIHTGQKTQVCDICKKEFSQAADLVKHMRIHTGEKPYVCDICNKGFSQSSNLVSHKRTHTGQKPYICDICEKGFSNSSSLVKHKRIHSGEKPYVCDICTKGFSDSSNLVQHKLTHIGQSCV